MIKNRAARVATMVFLATLVMVVVGVVVRSLWNWLMPALFGLRTIGYWQAIGILILSKLLFGGLRGGRGGHMRWRNRMRERMEGMTPEEREKFREGMRGRCGSFGGTAPETKA